MVKRIIILRSVLELQGGLDCSQEGADTENSCVDLIQLTSV